MCLSVAARFRRWTKKTRPGPAGPLQSAPSSAGSLDKALTDRLKEAEEAPAQAGGRYRQIPIAGRGKWPHPSGSSSSATAEASAPKVLELRGLSIEW